MSNRSIRHRVGETSAVVATEAAMSLHVDFLEAMVAAGTLMAHADGEMASVERRKLLGLLREHPALSVFAREQVVDEVAEHEANFRLDPEVAQLLAREKLVQVADRPRLARQVVDLCREIIPADGVRHPSEYRVLATIREALRLAEEAPAAFPRL